MRRFTDTNKWDDPWFRQLPGVQKLMFLYVIDRCNNAGFWEVDEDAISWHTKVDKKHFEGAWEGLARGIQGASGWVWVRRFLKHQKNDPLNLDNPAHRQIFALIKEQVGRFGGLPEFKEFIAPYKGLTRPIGIGKGTGLGKKESAEREQEAERIYQAYPLKKAKPEAIKAICTALTKTDFNRLLERTQSFTRARNGDLSYVPNPATWFNQEQFNDDPSTWVPRTSGKNGKPIVESKSDREYREWREKSASK